MATIARDCVIDFLRQHCTVIGVLIGAALVSFSLGPYSNFDTEVEFAAASSVVTQGLPFSSPGNLVNQPPLGFYLNAFFLRTFGLSYATGVAAVTLWGVGCVFLVYQVGRTFYNSRTGLVAAGVFALMPWEAVLARSFLIDVPCIFFSLLSLLVGVWAVRKASLKLTLVSGILFGFAFLTKFFAIFTLIPLALILVRYPPKNLKLLAAQVGIFALPVLSMYYLWYEGISRLGFFSFFGHNDFSSFTQGAAPSSHFLLRFFADNPGTLLLLAAAISILLVTWTRKDFKAPFFDLVCLVTIVGTAGVNMFLVLSLGLLVPYVDPVKYDYQALPAFCLLAASLLEKARLLRPLQEENSKRSKLPFLASVVGVILLSASIAASGITLAGLVSKDTVLFKVEGDIAFSFQNVGLVPDLSLQYALLTIGFFTVVVSMVFALRQKPSSKL